MISNTVYYGNMEIPIFPKAKHDLESTGFKYHYFYYYYKNK